METEAGAVTVIGTLLVTNNCRQLALRQRGEPRGQRSGQGNTRMSRMTHNALDSGTQQRGSHLCPLVLLGPRSIGVKLISKLKKIVDVLGIELNHLTP